MRKHNNIVVHAPVLKLRSVRIPGLRPMEVIKIEGKKHKPQWEYDKEGGYNNAMAEEISGILEEKKQANIQWHSSRINESSTGIQRRRFYDLKNMTQCDQDLVDGDEWKDRFRLVKIRRIYREVTLIDKDKKKRTRQADKVKKSASSKKVKKVKQAARSKQ